MEYEMKYFNISRGSGVSKLTHTDSAEWRFKVHSELHQYQLIILTTSVDIWDLHKISNISKYLKYLQTHTCK